MALRRIQNELADLQRDPPEHISVRQLDVNLWEATILGPPDTPYEGQSYLLHITFPANYPFRAPHVLFQTKIANRCIGPDGQICLNILKSDWSPLTTARKVLVAIYGLLKGDSCV